MTAPHIAWLDCDECCKWFYDVHTGEKQEHAGPRPKHVRPSCQSCSKCYGQVKASPRIGKQHTLSNRNWQTYMLFHEHQGSGGEVCDPIMRHNFGIIHLVLDGHRHGQQRHIIKLLEKQ